MYSVGYQPLRLEKPDEEGGLHHSCSFVRTGWEAACQNSHWAAVVSSSLQSAFLAEVPDHPIPAPNTKRRQIRAKVTKGRHCKLTIC